MITRLALGAALLLGLAGFASAHPATVAAQVNLRAGPGTGHAVIATVPKGMVVDVRSCRSSWCEVSWRSRHGFISRSYLADRPSVSPYLGALLSPPHSISARDAWTRAPVTPGAGCFVRGALWAIGRPATSSVLQRARWGAAARSVHLVRPGMAAKMPFIAHRLTLAVDKRNVIWDVRCG